MAVGLGFGVRGGVAAGVVSGAMGLVSGVRGLGFGSWIKVGSWVEVGVMGWGGLEFASKVRSSSIVLRGSLVNVWFHPRNGSVLALDEGGVMFAGAADAWAMDVVLSAVVDVGGSEGVAAVVRGVVVGAVVGACVPKGICWCRCGVRVGCWRCAVGALLFREFVEFVPL